MIVTITLKLTSPFLGSSKPNANGVREIIKAENKNPTLFIKRFCKLCKKYANELGIANFKYNSINIPNYLKTNANEVLYQKSIKTIDGTIKDEKFQSYPVGSLMTLDCCIDTSVIEINKAIKILELIGKYDGISQFGIQKNFGRFDVLLCQQEIA